MIKIGNANIFGWEPAIRGMRNPMNSWEKSDSYENYTVNYEKDENTDEVVEIRSPYYRIGAGDLALMKKLASAGTDHRKFMRMITVYADITAPLYWWKEFDTYKVGTVANSCSTMHKIAAKEFKMRDFSCEHLKPTSIKLMLDIIDILNKYRADYNNPEAEKLGVKKDYWWQMIQLLPSSYNQRRMVMLNYEVLCNIYRSRNGHKLDEWREFCKWIESLPYSELITGKVDE